MANRKVGRPRTRRSDLEPFTARFTPEAKKRLMALAQISDRAAYALLEDAFWDHWEQLPQGHREAAEAIVRAIDSARGEEK